jgi:hypothetical protein
VVLFLLIAAQFSLNFAKTGEYYLDINKFINGDATIPYQYRILTAPIFKGLLSLFGSFDLTKVLEHCPVYISQPVQLAYFLVNFISYFAALTVFSLIAKEVFNSRQAAFYACSIFIVMTYFVFILNPDLQFILPYDLPSLAFTQICVLLVLRRQWPLLCVVFAIATFNRETMFLVILFTFTRAWTGSEERKTGLAVTAVLAVIWLAVKAILAYFIKGGASDAALGGVAAFKLVYNLTTLLKPWQWPALFPLLLPLALTVYFLFKKPSKQALDWIAPYLLGFAMLLVVAQITEHRAFGDLIGFAAMSATFFLIERGFVSIGGVSARTADLQS